MQSVKNLEEDPFYDKRDQNYRQLISEHRYFDLFTGKKEKCTLKIPDTVIFQNGRILKWFFNSKQDDSDEILTKNTDKLNISKLFVQFSGLKKQAEGMTPLQILDYMRTEPIAHAVNGFIRCSNHEKFSISPLEIVRVSQEQSNQANSIQNMVNLKICTRDSRETMYSDYRNDPGQVGPLYRYYKKTFFVAKRPEYKFSYFKEEDDIIFKDLKKKKPVPFSEILWNDYENSSNYPNPHRVNIDVVFDGHIEDVNKEFGNEGILYNTYAREKLLEVRVKREVARGYINSLTESVFTKTSDQAVNRKIEAATKKFVNFIEATYKIKVRKLISKFLLDREENIVFIGAKDLRFELLPNADYNHIEVNSLLGYQVTCEELTELIKQFKTEKVHKVVLTDPKQLLSSNTKGTAFLSARERPISSNLYQKLVIRECGGDFCAFYLNNPDKLTTGAESKKTENSDNVRVYMKNESHEIVHSPFEMNNILKVKCRERLEDVALVLKQNHILPEELKTQQYGYNYDGIDEIYFKHLSKVFSQGREVENVVNLYKTLKVCKMCYTAYSLMRKHFDKHDVSEDSYFRFNQKYSKVGLPKGRYSTKLANQSHAESFQNKILSDIASHLVRPESGLINREEKIRKNITLSKVPRSEQTLTSGLKISFEQDWQQSLVKTWRIKTEETVKDTLIKTDAESSKNGSHLNLTSTIEQPSKKSLKFITSRKVRPETARASEQRSFHKHKLISPKTTQMISNSRLKLGVASFTALPNDLTMSRTENLMSTKHSKVTNLYDVLSDNQNEGVSSMKIKKYSGLATMPIAGGSLTDLKQPKTFEGLIKSIHKEKSKNDKNRSDRKARSILLKDQSNTSQYHETIVRCEAFYKGFRTLRDIHPNKITSPKVPFNLLEAKKFEDLKSLPLAKYCEKVQMTPPGIDDEELKFFVYSTVVGVPYVILESSVIEGKKVKNLVVCNDLFDNFIGVVDQYKELAERVNYLRVILFNLPGQAFTSYDPQETYNNEFCSVLVDTLLFHLEETGEINFTREDFYFVGFGFGGNVLAHLMHNAQDIIQSIKGLLVINTFTNVDTKMIELLDQLSKVFSECPPDMADLAYSYQSILYGAGPVNKTEIAAKIAANPISIPGRLTMIRSVKQTVDITRQFQSIKTPIFIVRSTRNCMVPLDSMDAMMKILRELEFIYEEKISNLMKNKILIIPPTGSSYLRKSIFYEGPHNIIEQRPEDAIKLVESFLSYFK